MITQMLDRIIFEKNVLQSVMKGNERLKREEAKMEPIHVIMNGPSLNDSKYFIKNRPGKILMANKMICHLDDFEMTPDYYCMADPGFFELHPVPKVAETLKALREYTGNLILFVTSGFPKTFLDQFKFETRIVNATQLPQYYSTNFMVKKLTKNIASPRFINVAVLGLYVALQLGYKEIYLHGCDLNGLGTAQVDVDNRWVYYEDHSYEKCKEPIKLIEACGHEYTLEYCLECNVLAYKNLRVLRRYADECGADIVNMSPHSWVECFRKFHLEDFQ